MGVVWKAEDTRLHPFVPVKFLPDDLGANPPALARLRREAQAASALNHPNICTLYDIGETSGAHGAGTHAGSTYVESAPRRGVRAAGSGLPLAARTGPRSASHRRPRSFRAN